MSTYSAIPNDTLFFRGGEPMEIGESHFQTSIFPPSPETLIGAIRTLIIVRNSNGDFEGYKTHKYKEHLWYKEIGFETLPDTFSFIGPFLMKDNKLLLSPPSNLFTTIDKNKFTIAAPRYFEGVKHFSSLKNIMWIDKHDDVDSSEWKPVEGHITIEGMKKYLKGSIDSIDYDSDFIQTTDIFEDEQRTGIALEQGLRTVRLGHLYMTCHKRFKEDAGMIFFLNGVSSFPNSDIIQLGGENRTVIYEKVDDIDMPSFKRNVDFLVTTMPFKVNKVINGIPIPEFLDDDFNVVLPGGVKSKLMSYAVNRPLFFGGWDMARNKSKNMIQYLPAGSVFYFEECTVNAINNNFLLGGKNVQ